MEQIQKPQTLQPTKVNLERSESSISDQYDNLVDGLQKEGTQNSWDARIDKVTANGWSVKFSLNTEESTLKVEDNGTTGMNESKWEKFHGLWYSDKSDSEDLGYRGQGKLLLHACGEFVIAETVDDKGVYRCRYSEPKGYDDFEGKKKRELYHQGTLITIYHLKPEVKKQLLNQKRFIRYIQLTWWEIIQDYGAAIIYSVDGKETRVEPLEQPSYKAQNKMELDNVTISKGGKTFGVLKNITFHYADQSVPEDQIGVAINVRGQTITRWTPSLMGSQGRRFFGSCRADFLRHAELPNHGGFKAKDSAWKEVRDLLGLRIHEFLEPLVRSDMTIDPKEQELADEMLQEINKTLEFFDDISELTKSSPQASPKEVEEQKKRTPKKHNDIFILSLLSDKGGEYQRKDLVQITVRSENPFPMERKAYKETLSVRDPLNAEIYSGSKEMDYVARGDRESFYTFKIPEFGLHGKYLVLAMIKNPEGKEASHRSIILSVGVPLEEDTQEQKEKQKEKEKENANKGKDIKDKEKGSKKLDPQEKQPDAGGKEKDEDAPKQKGLRLIKLVKSTEMEKSDKAKLEGPESILLEDSLTLLINLTHPAAKYALGHAAKKGALKYHIFKCAIDELLKLWTKKELTSIESDEISPAVAETLITHLFDKRRQMFARWSSLSA